MKTFNRILVIISLFVFCSCGHKALFKYKEREIPRKDVGVVQTPIEKNDSVIIEVKQLVIWNNLSVPIICDVSPVIRFKVSIKNNTSKDVAFCTYCRDQDDFFYFDNSFYGIKNKDTIKFGVEKYEKKTLAREINFKNRNYFRRYVIRGHSTANFTLYGDISLRSLPRLKNGDNLKEILAYLKGYSFYFIPHYVAASSLDKNANVTYMSKGIAHITSKTKFKTSNFKDAEIWVRRQRQCRRY